MQEFESLGQRALACLPPNSKTMGKRAWCRKCRLQHNNAYQKRMGKKASPLKVRRNGLKQDYDMTLEEYQVLFNQQNGVCAICGDPETTFTHAGKLKPLAVDHDHETGRIRGLLSQPCNIALGNYDKLKPMFNVFEAYLSQK